MKKLEDLEIGEEAEDDEEVLELLKSLQEDIYELIKITTEENSTKAYNLVLDTKDEALRSVKTLVGGILLSPANHLRIVKLTMKTAKMVSLISPASYIRIAKLYASIAKISGKFVKANIDMLIQ